MLSTDKYMQYSLVCEMMEACEILHEFRLKGCDELIAAIKKSGKLLLTGEGSNRIFPANNAVYTSFRAGVEINLITESSRQAGEYDLSDFSVIGASSSGETKELIWLMERFASLGKADVFALTANQDSKLSEIVEKTFTLKCGVEICAAATKSVVEQALFYQELLAQLQGRTLSGKFSQMADAFSHALQLEISPDIIKTLAQAEGVYFAGRNDGVSQELAVKANEIMCKKSQYLEGTSLLHGIEKVIGEKDVVVLVNPFGAELENIKATFSDTLGLSVVAISDEETIFPTIKVKDIGELQNYVYLAAGWNLLVEVGLSLNLNLDEPNRSR